MPWWALFRRLPLLSRANLTSGVLLSTSGKEQNRSTVREVRCPGHTAHTLQHPTPPRRSGAGSWVSITSCPASTKEKSRSCEQGGEAGGEGLSRGETWIRRQGISHTKVWREPSGDRSPSRSRCGVFKEQKEAQCVWAQRVRGQATMHGRWVRCTFFKCKGKSLEALRQGSEGVCFAFSSDRFAPWGQGTPAAVALAREAETE